MSKNEKPPLTKLQFAQLAVEQGGLCGNCAGKLVFAPFKIRDEHLGQFAITKDNSLKNRSLWCVPCTKPKDKADAKIRAKDRRARGVNKPKVKKKIQGRKLGQKHKSNTRVEAVYD